MDLISKSSELPPEADLVMRTRALAEASLKAAGEKLCSKKPGGSSKYKYQLIPRCVLTDKDELNKRAEVARAKMGALREIEKHDKMDADVLSKIIKLNYKTIPEEEKGVGAAAVSTAVDMMLRLDARRRFPDPVTRYEYIKTLFARKKFPELDRYSVFNTTLIAVNHALRQSKLTASALQSVGNMDTTPTEKQKKSNSNKKVKSEKSDGKKVIPGPSMIRFDDDKGVMHVKKPNKQYTKPIDWSW